MPASPFIAAIRCDAEREVKGIDRKARKGRKDGGSTAKPAKGAKVLCLAPLRSLRALAVDLSSWWLRGFVTNRYQNRKFTENKYVNPPRSIFGARFDPLVVNWSAGRSPAAD